jgi:hypothetical protein
MNAHVITFIETGLKYVTSNYINGVINDDEYESRLIAYNIELKTERDFIINRICGTHIYADYEPTLDGKQSNRNRMK